MFLISYNCLGWAVCKGLTCDKAEVRTRAIQRKLGKVQEVPQPEALDLIEEKNGEREELPYKEFREEPLHEHIQGQIFAS